jgi:hypothetical protein
MLKDGPQIAHQIRGNLRVHLVELLREGLPIYRPRLKAAQNLSLLKDPRGEVLVAGDSFLFSSRQHMHNPKSGKITIDVATILTKPHGGRY